MLSKLLVVPGKNILVVGNRSYKNLGDELILLGTIKLLLKQNKEIWISAYDPSWLKGFLAQHIDMEHIHLLTELPKGIRSGLRYLITGKWRELIYYRKMDAVIIGGGEILTEENPNSYRYWLVSCLPCLFKITPLFLMGGIQIPKKFWNRIFFNFLLWKTKQIHARDFSTVEELKHYDFHRVDVFMDTSYFAYDWKSSQHKAENEQKLVLVNMNKRGEKFYNQLVQDIIHYSKQGFHITYIPVSKGHQKDYNDIYYYHKLQKDVAEYCKLDVLDWEGNFDSFVKILSQAHLVISTRLHLFLISSFLKVPTKVYPYQRKILKMKEVIEKLGI